MWVDVYLILYFVEHCKKETGTFMYVLYSMPKLRWPRMHHISSSSKIRFNPKQATCQILISMLYKSKPSSSSLSICMYLAAEMSPSLQLYLHISFFAAGVMTLRTGGHYQEGEKWLLLLKRKALYFFSEMGCEEPQCGIFGSLRQDYGESVSFSGSWHC